MPARRDLKVRLLEKVVVNEHGCWVWQGHVMATTGYGRIGTGNGKGTDLTHRVSWRLHRDSIPDGIYVCHSCDAFYPVDSIEYRRCINPEHLYLDTNSGNVKRAFALGRNSHDGERNPARKLSLADVEEAKAMVAGGRTVADVARHFNLSHSAIKYHVAGGIEALRARRHQSP